MTHFDDIRSNHWYKFEVSKIVIMICCAIILLFGYLAATYFWEKQKDINKNFEKSDKILELKIDNVKKDVDNLKK